MDNRIILITGATDGIGKESSKALAKQGHTIIIHGRNEKKLRLYVLKSKKKHQQQNWIS